jgi:hypothetical protein
MKKVYDNYSVSGEAAVTATTVEEMKKLAESFNEMMKEQIRDEFDTAVITLNDIVEQEGKEDKLVDHFSLGFEFLYDYEEEWRKFALEQGKMEPSIAIEFYRQNGDIFINDEVMEEYIQELADEYGVDDTAFFTQGVKIYMENPYYDQGLSDPAITASDAKVENKWILKERFILRNEEVYFHEGFYQTKDDAWVGLIFAIPQAKDRLGELGFEIAEEYRDDDKAWVTTKAGDIIEIWIEENDMFNE